MKNLYILLLSLISINSLAQTEVMSMMGMKEHVFRTLQDDFFYDSKDTIVIEQENGNLVNYIFKGGIVDHAIIVRSANQMTTTLTWLETLTKEDDYYFYSMNDHLYGLFLMELMDESYFGLFVTRMPD